jgi:DNA-binding LacI/PurR family transcriptional regulator
MGGNSSRKRKLTILHVAREAGVSYQTVSRVLNDRPDVAPATRDRVQAIISRLGFQPNASARSLASKRTHTLGLITADFSDYFFTQVIVGAELEARAHGYRFMLGSTERNPQDEPAYLHLLAERHVDGILLAQPGAHSESQVLHELLNEGVPVVTTAYYLAGASLTVVDIDNIDGGYQAAKCLLDYGHREIAVITGPASWKSVSDRAAGYLRALHESGIEPRAELYAAGDWSYQSGYEAAQALLEHGCSFTAIFAQNDQMAIGALRALREAGLRVPRDVSVVGYDDIPAAAYADPPLTTIRQPMREAGALAARLLIDAIEGRSAQPHDVLLRTELAHRESCGKARKVTPRKQ